MDIEKAPILTSEDIEEYWDGFPDERTFPSDEDFASYKKHIMNMEDNP